MNISYAPIQNVNLPPVMEEVGHEFIKATAFLLIPTEALYFSIYFHMKGAYKVYRILTFLSIAAFWISPYAAPIECGPLRCLQNFTSTPTTSNKFNNDMLTTLSCNWDNEKSGSMGTSPFHSRLHSWQETTRLASSAYSTH
jgi:hypothetical protein